MMSEDVHKAAAAAAAAAVGTAAHRFSAFSRYGPCRRNHALGSGGNLLDGCQEFDADPESSKVCSACGCHRSFHVKLEDAKTDMQPGATTGAFPSLVVPSTNLFAAVSPDSSREGHAGNERTFVTMKGRKPCRSKQLRAKACQIWSEYLRPWASSQGISIRFCDTKELCVSEMEKGEHSQCRLKCNQLKWPLLVPFIHPKDMASKELQQFISTYERDWQEYCSRNASPASCSLAPRLRKVFFLFVVGAICTSDLDPCKVSTKELRYWLRENGKAVFCVHPKAANQFVNMGKLATMILRSGGKCKFEAANGWDTFVSSHEGMNKPALTTAERRKCIRTIKRLYNKFMMEFIQETLRDMGLENDGDLAIATVSDDGANEDEDDSVDGDLTKASSNKHQQQQHQQQQQLYLRDGESSQRCLGVLGLM